MWIGLGVKFSRVFHYRWCLLKPRFILPSAHLHQNPSFLFYLCIFPESLSDCAAGVQGRGRMCARFASAPVSQLRWHPVSQDTLLGGGVKSPGGSLVCRAPLKGVSLWSLKERKIINCCFSVDKNSWPQHPATNIYVGFFFQLEMSTPTYANWKCVTLSNLFFHMSAKITAVMICILPH